MSRVEQVSMARGKCCVFAYGEGGSDEALSWGIVGAWRDWAPRQSSRSLQRRAQGTEVCRTRRAKKLVYRCASRSCRIKKVDMRVMTPLRIFVAFECEGVDPACEFSMSQVGPRVLHNTRAARKLDPPSLSRIRYRRAASGARAGG
jgi:hypothetical protein